MKKMKYLLFAVPLLLLTSCFTESQMRRADFIVQIAEVAQYRGIEPNSYLAQLLMAAAMGNQSMVGTPDLRISIADSENVEKALEQAMEDDQSGGFWGGMAISGLSIGAFLLATFGLVRWGDKLAGLIPKVKEMFKKAKVTEAELHKYGKHLTTIVKGIDEFKEKGGDWAALKGILKSSSDSDLRMLVNAIKEDEGIN